ncbi:MAG: hypothetical protein IJA58_04130 [Lachnospiraceae bacterium]|nr:hypothetical protein [Lachnospiraceae bacterium]
MWTEISILLMIIEIVLLTVFVIAKLNRKKLNEKFLFLGAVFMINLALYLVPYLHRIWELREESNYPLDILECIVSAVKLFLGDVKTEGVAGFAKTVPVFTLVYVLGVVLALLTTISTAVEIFNQTLRNHFRLSKALNQSCCDIILGDSKRALQYAKDGAAVLLLDENTNKNRVVGLIEAGYAVLRNGFSVQLLKSRQLNKTTRYNLICPNDEEKYLDYINTYIDYRSVQTETKNFYLYVEIEEEKTATIRREIIEKSGFGSWITTFCSKELLARTFMEEHPITQYLPKEFIDADASIRPDVKINVFHLGFERLGRELYRQSILNNQLVKFEDNEYKVFPVNYYIFDPSAKSDDWDIQSLENVLKELKRKKDDYFTLPELPFITESSDKEPGSRETLSWVGKKICEEKTFSYVIVDSKDDYCNIEIGARLRSMLDGEHNFHLYIHSEESYTKDDDLVTYFGKVDQVFTHEMIVNDSLSTMAKRLNEVYTEQSMKDASETPGFAETVKRKAEEEWNGFDYFTRYSNLYAAMNLRLKLNLLGLDYVKDGKGENTKLIEEKYPRREDAYKYQEYFVRSKRNALLAQEHARWNAYHLLEEYLPLAKNKITVKTGEKGKVRFNTKNTPAKLHACLTTYKGLGELSAHLADRAAELTGTSHRAEEYDYYMYDEMLLKSSKNLLMKLGYSVVEK